MPKSYHVAQSLATQLPLFSLDIAPVPDTPPAPLKKCSRCPAIYPATLQYFHPHAGYPDSLNSACRDCRKEIGRRSAERTHAKKRGETVTPIERKPTPMVSLICTICGKEFQRERGAHAFNVRQGRTTFYCSPDCRKKKDVIPLPDSIKEQYLAGALLLDIAKHHHVSLSVIRRRLIDMGVPIRSVESMNTLRGSPMKGKTHTEEARQKISEAQLRTFSDPANLEAMRQRTIKQMSEGKMNTSSRLEDRVALELSRQGFAFFRQHGVFCKGKQGYAGCVDFLLSDGRAIEVNGTYWHCDPRKYPSGPINATQKQAIERHSRKMEMLAEAGVPVIEIWEIDLTVDLAGTIARALSTNTPHARTSPAEGL